MPDLSQITYLKAPTETLSIRTTYSRNHAFPSILHSIYTLSALYAYIYICIYICLVPATNLHAIIRTLRASTVQLLQSRLA